MVPAKQRTPEMQSAAQWEPLEAALLVKLFNELFGQGTITLAYVTDEMPNDAYEAWWSFFSERSKHVLHQQEQAEHDSVMDSVNRALNRIH